MSTELRKLRDEIAEIVERDGYVIPTTLTRRWLATLDAYLAVPRCPGCGSTSKPRLGFQWSAAQHFAECRSCAHSGPDRDTEAEALAAFYEAAE